MFRQITVITNTDSKCGQRKTFTVQFCEDVAIENGDLSFRGYTLHSNNMEDFVFTNSNIHTILFNND